MKSFPFKAIFIFKETEFEYVFGKSLLSERIFDKFLN